MDEATGKTDEEVCREIQERYGHLVSEVERLVIQPIRRAYDAMMDAVGDRELDYYGVRVTVREALTLERDQSLYGSAYIMVDDDDRARRLDPTQVRTIP